MSQVTAIHIYMWFLYTNKLDFMFPLFLLNLFSIMKPVFLTAFCRTEKNVSKIVI